MAVPQLATEEEERGWRILSPDEGRAFFDEASRNLLGISGEEFLRRWDAGDYRDLPDAPESSDVAYMAMMMPFARQIP